MWEHSFVMDQFIYRSLGSHLSPTVFGREWSWSHWESWVRESSGTPVAVQSYEIGHGWGSDYRLITRAWTNACFVSLEKRGVNDDSGLIWPEK
jgi:hypothetical protein